MMRVRILSPVFDTNYGACQVGQELDMHDHHAIPLIRGGIAESILPSEEGDRSDPEWEFRIPPRQYLRRFPQGRAADRAREILSR